MNQSVQHSTLQQALIAVAVAILAILLTYTGLVAYLRPDFIMQFLQLASFCQ